MQDKKKEKKTLSTATKYVTSSGGDLDIVRLIEDEAAPTPESEDN